MKRKVEMTPEEILEEDAIMMQGGDLENFKVWSAFMDKLGDKYGFDATTLEQKYNGVDRYFIAEFGFTGKNNSGANVTQEIFDETNPEKEPSITEMIMDAISKLNKKKNGMVTDHIEDGLFKVPFTEEEAAEYKACMIDGVSTGSTKRSVEMFERLQQKYNFDPFSIKTLKTDLFSMYAKPLPEFEEELSEVVFDDKDFAELFEQENKEAGNKTPFVRAMSLKYGFNHMTLELKRQPYEMMPKVYAKKYAVPHTFRFGPVNGEERRTGITEPMPNFKPGTGKTDAISSVLDMLGMKGIEVKLIDIDADGVTERIAPELPSLLKQLMKMKGNTLEMMRNAAEEVKDERGDWIAEIDYPELQLAMADFHKEVKRIYGTEHNNVKLVVTITDDKVVVRSTSSEDVSGFNSIGMDGFIGKLEQRNNERADEELKRRLKK